MITGIYKITNINNNKVYIGQSNDIERRRKEHWEALTLGTHHNKYLQEDYNKHNSFDFDVLEECSIDDLNERELYWINIYNALNRSFGYNISTTPYTRPQTEIIFCTMDNITSLQDKNTEAIKTHIPCVDEVFGGLRRGCLYSFCAGTGVGKSTILLSTAKFLAAQGYKVLFLSVEMDVVALSQYITEPLPTLGFCNFYDIPEYWKMVESKINEFDIICYDYLGATLEDWNQLITKADKLANLARKNNKIIITANQMNTADFKKDMVSTKGMDDILYTTKYISYAKGMATKLSGGAYLVKTGAQLYLYPFKNRYETVEHIPHRVDGLDYKTKTWRITDAKEPNMETYSFKGL